MGTTSSPTQFDAEIVERVAQCLHEEKEWVGEQDPQWDRDPEPWAALKEEWKDELRGEARRLLEEMAAAGLVCELADQL